MYFNLTLTESILLGGLVFFTLQQLIFSSKVTIAALRYKVRQKNADGISVIVAAHYEFQNLQRLLPVLLQQDHPEFEIIIVDDRSEDGTYEYLLEMKEKHDNLKWVRIDHVPDHANAKKYALTLGIKAAKYEQLLFTDADCFPVSNQWISHMASGFTKDNTFVLGYSQYEKQKGLLNYLIRYETLITGIQYFAAAQWGAPYMGVGRNMGYKKSFFLDVNGFGPWLGKLGGDDDLMVNKYGKGRKTRTVFHPEAKTLSVPKKTWQEYFRQKRRHLAIGRHYRWLSRMKIGWRMTSWLLFYVFFILACFLAFKLYVVIGSLIVRVLGWLLALFFFKKKSGDDTGLWPVVIFDLLFILFYYILGLSVLIDKRVTWK